jgi:hypothetical protein
MADQVFSVYMRGQKDPARFLASTVEKSTDGSCWEFKNDKGRVVGRFDCREVQGHYCEPLPKSESLSYKE